MEILALLKAEQVDNISISIKLPDLLSFANALISETERKITKTIQEERTDRLITRTEARDMLRVSYPSLWRWQQTGKLCPVKIAGKIMYSLNDIQKIMTEGC